MSNLQEREGSDDKTMMVVCDYVTVSAIVSSLETETYFLEKLLIVSILQYNLPF